MSIEGLDVVEMEASDSVIDLEKFGPNECVVIGKTVRLFDFVSDLLSGTRACICDSTLRRGSSVATSGEAGTSWWPRCYLPVFIFCYSSSPQHLSVPLQSLASPESWALRHAQRANM